MLYLVTSLIPLNVSSGVKVACLECFAVRPFLVVFGYFCNRPVDEISFRAKALRFCSTTPCSCLFPSSFSIVRCTGSLLVPRVLHVYVPRHRRGIATHRHLRRRKKEKSSGIFRASGAQKQTNGRGQFRKATFSIHTLFDILTPPYHSFLSLIASTLAITNIYMHAGQSSCCSCIVQDAKKQNRPLITRDETCSNAMFCRADIMLQIKTETVGIQDARTKKRMKKKRSRAKFLSFFFSFSKRDFTLMLDQCLA